MDHPHDNAHLPQADDGVANTEIMEHPQTSTTEPISTDLLFSLPPELLLPIFSFVGVENFREDVRRLAVCKEWYAYAQPILLGNLRLRPSKDLLPMLRAMEGGPSLAAAQQMTKHIEVTVGSWPSAVHLERLASRLQVFAALRTLVIRSGGVFLYHTRMSSQVFSSFTVLQQLTSLEIDLGSVDLQQTSAHLCDSISQRIPTLKRLRCRLPRICNDLLDTQPGDLEELIIRITSPDHFHTRQCFTSLVLNDYEHRPTLEERLVQFAASMCQPKIVRLIHHFWNYDKTYAFDAIRERRFFLGQDPAWDTDGVLLPEGCDADQSEDDENWESEEGGDWEDDDDWGEDEERDEGDLVDEWLSD